MNKTVELVNEWAAYEANHPEAGIEEFCRHYLIRQRAQREHAPPFGGTRVPPTSRSFLSKLLGHISSTVGIYFEKSFADIPEIKQKEDFYFLNAISAKGECRKTEVVYEQLLGMTTGIDTINRLLAAGLITERPDPTDKRAKLVALTPKGQEVLCDCYAIAKKVTEIVFYDLSDEDVDLCIQLLRGIETRHSALIPHIKDLNIEQIGALVKGKAGDKLTVQMSKKALIQAYKNQKQRMGVFQIRNTVNGKIYLDTAPNLDKIWNRHHFELELGGHPNKALQREWKEFGEQAFVFEVLSEIEQKEGDTADYRKELKALYALYLDELQPYGAKGYHTQKQEN